MADLADVMDALEQIAIQAAYPNGTAGSSVSGRAVTVAQGWPLAADIDAAMRAGRSIVSVYAVPSSSSDVPQPFNLQGEVITAPVHGLSASVANNMMFTLTGSPGVGEYATAVVNGAKQYSAIAAGGDGAISIAAALAAQIAADFPGTSATAGAVTVAGAFSLVVRIGAPATVGDRIHRQRIQFRIVVWSPNPADRAAIAKAIDVALKRNIRITMPDTGCALVTFQGTNLDDKYENALVYRRDLIFNVMFDTVDEYPAYEITAVGLTLTPAGGPSVTTAQ